MMICKKKYYLTEEGLKQAKKKLKEIEKEKMKLIKERSPEKQDYGEADIEYVKYQEDMEAVEKKIYKLGCILDNYELIKKPSKEKRDKVHLGATVVVEGSGQVDEFTITGSFEADPLSGKISNRSPVGEALLGKRVGEEVEVETPMIKQNYKILKISYDKL